METFSYELKGLRGVILRPLILFFVVSLVLLVVGTPTLATRLFLAVKLYLLPPNVPLVALGPVSVFMAPMLLSFLISSLITFPYLLYSFGKYLRPALYPKERKVIYKFVLPSLILFYLGCAFGFFLIIPATFSILYSFAAPIGVTPYFSLDSFMSSVFLLTVSIGIIFLLPVVMTLLTRLTLVPHERWLQHWRGAIVASLIFCAVITPDGSGVTMIFLFIPLVLLYGIGIVLSRNRAKRNFFMA